MGWVPGDEAALFIRVPTAHRREAFGFLSEAITRMKRDVPIWKRAGVRRGNVVAPGSVPGARKNQKVRLGVSF
jgi:molybdopterin synthase catalytic subunit